MQKNQKLNSIIGELLPPVIIGAALMVLYIAVTLATALPNILCGIAAIILYAVAVCGYYYFRAHRRRQSDSLRPELGNIMLGVMTRLHMPSVICDDGGKIIWFNEEMTRATGKGDALYGSYIEKLAGIKAQDIVTSPEGAGHETVIGESHYIVNVYKIAMSEKEYRLLIFSDNTELVKMNELYFSERTTLAYVAVDNLDEIMQYVKEEYRNAASHIEGILREWAESYGGVIKEIEKDKYILVFDDAALDDCAAKNFDILDKIRETRIGDEGMPVTVSIGVAKIAGSISERERAASSALDMALQRGGDQAVLKTPDGVEIFGGKTKTVQKRTKVRARVIANKICSLMTQSDNVLIMGHRNSDFDSIGAALGVARLAAFCGVKVNIIMDARDRNFELCRPRFETLPEFEGLFVDKETALELIRSETLLVIVDVNNTEMFVAPDVYTNVGRTVYIDHHRKTGEYVKDPEIGYIEPSASSASELVAEILEQCLPNGELHREEAEMMFAGIVLDTKRFSRNTGSRTFAAALYLRGEGANPSDAIMLFNDNFDEFRRVAKFLTNMTTYHRTLAIAACEEPGDEEDRNAAAKASDKLLSVTGIEASFALVKIGNSVHISARSNGSINVQLILEKLHGGGHFDVAGAQLEGETVDAALILLRDAINEYFAADGEKK